MQLFLRIDLVQRSNVHSALVYIAFFLILLITSVIIMNQLNSSAFLNGEDLENKRGLLALPSINIFSQWKSSWSHWKKNFSNPTSNWDQLLEDTLYDCFIWSVMNPV